LDKWNAYNSAGTLPIAGIGYDDSIGIRVQWNAGTTSPGGFSIAFGDLPVEYSDETNQGGYVGPYEGWDHIISVGDDEKLQEVYVRQYIKFATGFDVRAGSAFAPKKFVRARILSDYKTADVKNYDMCVALNEPWSCCTGPGAGGCIADYADGRSHPIAYQGQHWPQINTYIGALFYNSTNAVCLLGDDTCNTGDVLSTDNNCIAPRCPLWWTPRVRGQTVMWKDYPSGDSDWICVESHIELNDPGPPAVANGTEEFWISDDLGVTNVLESSPGNSTPGTQNQRGTYDQYGINQIVFENFWNSPGAPSSMEIYRDNIVISTERIYCEVDNIGVAPGATPTPTSTPTATPTDDPPTPTATPTATPTMDPSDPTGVLP
jgi:hypothetical protein